MAFSNRALSAAAASYLFFCAQIVKTGGSDDAETADCFDMFLFFVRLSLVKGSQIFVFLAERSVRLVRCLWTGQSFV